MACSIASMSTHDGTCAGSPHIRPGYAAPPRRWAAPRDHLPLEPVRTAPRTYCAHIPMRNLSRPTFHWCRRSARATLRPGLEISLTRSSVLPSRSGDPVRCRSSHFLDGFFRAASSCIKARSFASSSSTEGSELIPNRTRSAAASSRVRLARAECTRLRMAWIDSLPGPLMIGASFRHVADCQISAATSSLGSLSDSRQVSRASRAQPPTSWRGDAQDNACRGLQMARACFLGTRPWFDCSLGRKIPLFQAALQYDMVPVSSPLASLTHE